MMRAVAEAEEKFTAYTSGPAALGTAFHMVAEEALRTLHRQGEQRIPTQEMIELTRQVLASDDCPHLTIAQQREMRILALQFCELSWPAERLIGIEQRLYATVPGPDGKDRRITGQPDVLLASPPHGAVCIDFKVSWSVPPAPRDGDFSRDGGRPYLSERGTFQLDTLGLLIMRSYPAIQRVILREYYPRLNEIREARLDRDDLEHVEKHLGLLAYRFERAYAGEIEAEPRPGKWCSHCPFSARCPVPHESRKIGAIDTDELADQAAGRYVAVEALRQALRGQLKARFEATGYAAKIGDGRCIRFDGGKGSAFEIVPVGEQEATV
jgi:hypothetical protein